MSACLTVNNHREDINCLGFQSIALRSERFPFFRVHDKTKPDPNASRYCGPILDEPTYHVDELFANVPVRGVAPYFQESFWANGVGAYGLKALRMHAAKQEVKVTMSLLENRIGQYSRFYDGLEKVKGLVNGVCNRIKTGGYAVALNYLNALVVERLRFPMAIFRWEGQGALFRARTDRAARDLWTTRTLALERRTLKGFLEMRAEKTPGGMLSGFVAESYARWERYVSYLPYKRPPRGSETLEGKGPVRFIEALGEVVVRDGCKRYLASLPDAYAFLVEELQHLEHAIFDAYMLDAPETEHLLERFGETWSSHVDGLITTARAFASDIGHFSGEHHDLPHWAALLYQLGNQLASMKQYLIFEPDMTNPVTMRHLFLSIGRGNGARRTPSARWAIIVGEQVAKMPMDLKVQFEQVVQIVTQHTRELPPHKTVRRLRDMGSENPLPPGARGAFADLVRELEEDPDVVSMEGLLQLAQTPQVDPADPEELRMAVEQARRRQEMRAEIRDLQRALEGSREVRGRTDMVYQTQQAVLHAQRRCENIERQIAELKQHHTIQDQVRIRGEIGLLHGTLAEMLDEVKLRERHAERATRDAASEARMQWEGRVEEEIRLLRRAEWEHEQQARGSGADGPRVDGGPFPPRSRKRRRDDALEPELESKPNLKRKQLRAQTVRSLLKEPPFLGGPTRIAGHPLPFGRSAQLRMPHGGLPVIRYEAKPLAVGGSAAIDIVEGMADTVERWREMGARQQYVIPKGAVEALAAVAGSERSGLPREA